MSKPNLRIRLKQNRLFFDGGYGTLFQSLGLPVGEESAVFNLTNPDCVRSVHEQYLKAGCNIIKTNTFGANPLKTSHFKEQICAGVACAKAACEGYKDAYIALDIGPLGQLLKPYGSLPFEEAVACFAEVVKVGASLGVDAILIETMNDAYETKAAVLAAKEHSTLPILVTNVYNEYGKLMTGADPVAMIALLEGLRVDALGMNCSLGPDKMLPLMADFRRYSSLPIIVNPNAGLPKVVDGQTVFSMDEETFAMACHKLAQAGATLIGGCCGSTPDMLARVIEKTKKLPFVEIEEKMDTLCSSYTHALVLDEKPLLIGERLNPTGKKALKIALKEGDIDYLLREGVKQVDSGAAILDVNVGLPEIDETSMMCQAITSLQAVLDTPLQIDSSSPTVLEQAARMYNGKPLLNSVNGKEESMKTVFPVVKKYGGVLIALTLDEHGIPNTAQERFWIAKRIIARAEAYGIKAKDIVVDPLALTISSNPESGAATLETIRLLKENGIKTSLGVSNISFGLPSRETINATFFAQALHNGLSLAIMNPFSLGMMDAYHAHLALAGIDAACENYIHYTAHMQKVLLANTGLTPSIATTDSTATTPNTATTDSTPTTPNTATTDSTRDRGTSATTGAENAEQGLAYTIQKGLIEEAKKKTKALLRTTLPLVIIQEHIVPALTIVGEAFDKGILYLPQLLKSAEAASSAFAIVKDNIPKNEKNFDAIILATVQGDIHDIGKNIVRVILESYGFLVHDLGKDVSPKAVLEAVKKHHCSLVGLSALMTTTTPAMEETIKLLHQECKGVRVIVGGAVLTEDYAKSIGADFYAKDAQDTVRYAELFYKK